MLPGLEATINSQRFMLDRKSPPEFHTIKKINVPGAESLILDNQIPVFLISAGKQPVIRLEFIFKAGSWYELLPGASYFATKMLSEGTSRLNSAEISNEVEKFGAHLDLSSSLDYVVVTLECLTKHLKNLLPLLRELIYDSSFPEHELLILKNIKSQQVKVNKEKTSILASVKFRENLFGLTHPYGRDLSVEDIQNLRISDVIDFYNDNFKGEFEIVVSGKPDQDTVKLINENFGQRNLTSLRNADLNRLANSAQEKTAIVQKSKSVQSSIRLGKKLFQKNHADLIDTLVLNEILGGYFGSRLMKNIREEKGYTYGISSSVITLKNEGFFIIGTDVNKENTQNTIDEIFKEIKVLQEENVPDEELETVKSYMIGSFIADINTPFALSDKFKSVHLNGMDYDYYDRYIERINNITAEELRDIAKRHFAIDTMYTVVVGGGIVA